MMQLATLLLLLFVTQRVTADNEPFLASTFYCNQNDTPECSNLSDRAWLFPPVRISFVCKYDFRQETPQPNPYFFPNTSSPTIQATWGPFIDYFLHLVPELGGEVQPIDDYGARFWMHGGEGRPGWEIPPCGTNRTEGVAHFWHFAVALNQTTTDPDLYNAGMTYAQALLYINQQSVRTGIEQYVCNDLERLDIAIDDGAYSYANHPDFYPRPEEICPRVTEDDETWKAWLILAAAVVALAALGGAAGYYLASRRRQNGATKQNNNAPPPSSFPEQAVENTKDNDPSSKV